VSFSTKFSIWLTSVNASSWLLPDHVWTRIVILVLHLLIRLTYPHNAWWLSPAEQRLARVRLAEDTGEADEDGVNDTYAKSFTEHLENDFRRTIHVQSMA